MRLLVEALLEHAESGRVRAADGDHDGVLRVLVCSGELSVEGVGERLGVGLVDLELRGKLGERAEIKTKIWEKLTVRAQRSLRLWRVSTLVTTMSYLKPVSSA